MFVYFLCFKTPSKRRVVRRRNLARRRVTTMSSTCTSVGFCVYGVRRFQKNDIFQKNNNVQVAVGRLLACITGLGHGLPWLASSLQGLKHRSCEQPEDVGAQFATSGSKMTLNNNKINN